MRVDLIKPDRLPNKRLCFICVTKAEALSLIRSLTNQLIANDPNTGRLESSCQGDAAGCTIFVTDRRG